MKTTQVDHSLETRERLTTMADHSLAHTVRCPASLCAVSRTCAARVHAEQARAATLKKGAVAPGAEMLYWKVGLGFKEPN